MAQTSRPRSAEDGGLLIWQSALDVGRLSRDLSLNAGRRQLKHGGSLTFCQRRQQHDLAIRELQRIVIGEWIVLIDAPEDRGFLVDPFLVPGPQTHTPNFGREGQLRARPQANCNVLVLRCGEPSRTPSKVPRG